MPGRLGLGRAAGLGRARRASWGSTPTRHSSPSSAWSSATACASMRLSALLGQARFAPVFHRPLFRHLGFVTNRTFETFYADTLPVLMLPRDFVAAIYGPAALDAGAGRRRGRASDGRAEAARALLGRGAADARHLARHHSYAQRFAGTRRAQPGRRAIRRSAVNILFVMKHRGNAGNTHAVANYMRVAPKYGHAVAMYGERAAAPAGAEILHRHRCLRSRRLPLRVRNLSPQAAAGGGDARRNLRGGTG